MAIVDSQFSKISPKDFYNRPKWQNVAQSGRTGSVQLYLPSGIVKAVSCSKCLPKNNFHWTYYKVETKEIKKEREKETYQKHKRVSSIKTKPNWIREERKRQRPLSERKERGRDQTQADRHTERIKESEQILKYQMCVGTTYLPQQQVPIFKMFVVQKQQQMGEMGVKT